MEITTNTTVGEVAAAYPASIKVFQKHGIDFCCGGKVPLATACAEKRLEPATVKAEIEAAVSYEPAPLGDWRDGSLTGLCAHIVSRYHFTLRAELPRLRAMAEKVLKVHGENHPEIAGITETFRAVQEELGPHMLKEERILFPYIQEMEGLRAAAETAPPPPFGTVENPVAMMVNEHETVGEALVTIRRLSNGYTPPADACNTFRGLYHGLAELERELHEHIHLENNVLFPRAVELEQSLSGAAVAAR